MAAKKPWFSKTMWLNFVGGIAAAAAAFFPQANVVSQFISSHLDAIGMIWAVVGMGLRMVTKDKIVLVD